MATFISTSITVPTAEAAAMMYGWMTWKPRWADLMAPGRLSASQPVTASSTGWTPEAMASLTSSKDALSWCWERRPLAVPSV